MRYGKTLRSLLLAAAILAPAVTLAVLGLRAYRSEAVLLRERYQQDQETMMRLIANRLSETARKVLDDLAAQALPHDPDATAEVRFRRSHPLARHIFVARRGRLVYPALATAGEERGLQRRVAGLDSWPTLPDVRQYVRRVREARRQESIVDRGLRAEFGGKLTLARQLYSEAARGQSDPAAQALLALARIARRQNNLEEARRHYETLRERFGGQRDREGISYALLADAELAALGLPEKLIALHDQLVQGAYTSDETVRHFYLRTIVERLARTAGFPAGQLALLMRTTSHLFAAERFAMLLERNGIGDLQQLATDRPSSLALDRRTILVFFQRDEALVGYSVDERYLQQEVSDLQREVVPPERGLRLSLERVGALSTGGGGRLLFASVLQPPLSHWTLVTHARAGDPMLLLEQRQGLRGLAVVVGLILALLSGLLLVYRSVRRESELAKMKGDFASNVSHELKTPLTSIRLYAEMLQHGFAVTPEAQNRYHRVIIREAERLGRLIANVLDFSKLERGSRRYNLWPEDLESMTREAVETFSRLSEGERMKIQLQGPPSPLPHVSADHEAAVQSILNLLSNAAKYAPQHPEIELSFVQQGNEVGVTVRDHGIGVPLREQQKIFEDFYRAPDSRRLGVEGTGLGLALVRRHMKACGGRVELESTPGEGSSFTLWFPLAAPQPQEVTKHGKDPDHRG